MRSAACLLLLALAASATAEEASVPIAGEPAAKSERWSSFLPLMAEEARKRGYELPLPFGVSGIYNYLERDIDIEDLRIGIDGAPPGSVSDWVDIGSNSRVNVGLGRFDAWLLPFLNLYALLGYIDNESQTRGTVTVGPRTFDFAADTSIQGVVGGLGMTLAAGYKDFFLMADANYSQTDLGFDDSFKALVASMRAGWNGRVSEVPTRFWAGMMYWDTRNTASSTVEVPGVGQVAFEADQGPRNPWNTSIGGQATFAEHWDVMAEYGFNFDDVKIFLTGVTYRF